MTQSRDDFAYGVARMYYFQNATMDAIARHYDVSRSTVSRALSEARETGIVQIRLERADEGITALERAIQREFDVNAHVVPAAGLSNAHRLASVSGVAAQLISDWMEPGGVLAVAAGTTLQAVADVLPVRQCPGSAVVQLHGNIAAMHHVTSGSSQSVLSGFAQAFGADEYPFPVPAYFDYAATRDAMWQERSIQRIRAMQSHADAAVFSVGVFRGQAPSWPYTSGALSDIDLDELRRKQVVGDVCTVMLRANGSSASIDVNGRSSGARPAELRHIPRRLLIAVGTPKVLPTVAALRARTATHLVIDDALAYAIVAALPGQRGFARP